MRKINVTWHNLAIQTVEQNYNLPLTDVCSFTLSPPAEYDVEEFRNSQLIYQLKQRGLDFDSTRGGISFNNFGCYKGNTEVYTLQPQDIPPLTNFTHKLQIILAGTPQEYINICDSTPLSPSSKTALATSPISTEHSLAHFMNAKKGEENLSYRQCYNFAQKINALNLEGLFASTFKSGDRVYNLNLYGLELLATSDYDFHITSKK